MFYILVFLIIYGSLLILDKYFYGLLAGILVRDGQEALELLDRLGYYNKSAFKSFLSPLIIAGLLSLLIYLIHIMVLKRERTRLDKRIGLLEEDLIRINKGDYSVSFLEEDDQLSSLKDQVHKIIVNLKSLEEEASKQRLELKEDLSNIAHQIKTPLTSIGFMAELIESDRENMDQYLDRLKKEIDRLNEFTDILLKLSKVNSNSIDYSFEEIDLREIFEDILNKLNRHGEIEVDFKGEDLRLKGDDIWLYEAFLNIVKNSLEHCHTRLEIEFGSNPIYKEVFIRDDGQGLEDSKLGRIFERFYKGDTRSSGYGIGLNLSKSIIEEHKGEIRAYQEDGLTFHIKFYNVT